MAQSRTPRKNKFNAPRSSVTAGTEATAAHSREESSRAFGAKVAGFFRSLPIRFKLSLIIGSIVVLVISIFSLTILHNQQTALMSRMNQVCKVLVQNLSETAKGDLLLGKNNKVKETVLRLKNTDIEGLKQVAILNHKAELVAAFDKAGEKINIDIPADLHKIDQFTSIERSKVFEYYYPIETQGSENSREKNVQLGFAYVSFYKDAILAPIQNARKIALGSALMIILWAIIVIYLIAKKMASQIKLLSDGARQVGAGNLGVEIHVDSRDELGQLATEFNKMIQQLREKLQMQKFVSKFTVDMIKDTVGKNGDRSKAIKRNVTVLFSDVRNFSSIAEELAPEEIVKLINIYFDIQTRVIESQGGIVDKFMGDQIMAIFVGRDMADSALLSAVEIQRQIRLLNQERSENGEPKLEIGIGINNGAAVMGRMGSSDRMDYTVIGDVVNVAARLCSAAKAGQIITSFDVAKKVNGSYPTSRLRSISVKGRSRAIEVCEVDYDRDILT